MVSISGEHSKKVILVLYVSTDVWMIRGILSFLQVDVFPVIQFSPSQSSPIIQSCTDT